MRMNNTSTNRKRRGIGMIWLILSFMTFVVFAALVIDTSRVYVTGHQLQNAADAAALAGARYVAWDPNTATKLTARETAWNVAQSNQANNLAVNLYLNTSNAFDGDIVIGIFNPDEPDPSARFTVMDPADFAKRSPNAMKVVTRKNDDQNPRLPLLFASIFGVNFSTIQKDATAMIYNIKGAAIIALSKTQTGIYLHGNPAINITNDGSMYANTVDVAADFRGNPATEVAEINLVGKSEVHGNFNTGDMTYEGLPTVLNEGMPPIKDPYALLLDEYSTVPAGAILNADGTTTPINTIEQAGTAASPKVYLPGYYSGGFKKPNSGYITLMPGIYHLAGAGLNITNAQSTVVANQVMFHIVSGSVSITGGNLTLSPPTSAISETYSGISIFQSRSNTSKAFIRGNGGLNMTGVLYFPNAPVELEGGGGTMGSQLIADTIELGGNGEINIPYMGSPEVAETSYLVE